jgi:hypothetical protein
MAATTVVVDPRAFHNVPKPFSAGMVGSLMTAALATTSLDDVGDTVEMGYVPGNCILLGFVIQTASLAASGLIYKIQVNGVDVITAIATGNAGAAAAALALIVGAPLVIPNGPPQKVQIVITTVATTPAAGSFNLIPIYLNQ